MTAPFEVTGKIPADRGRVLERDAAAQPRSDTVSTDGQVWGAVGLRGSHSEQPLEGRSDTSTLVQQASIHVTRAAEEGSGAIACFPWEGYYQDVEAPQSTTLETFLHSNMYGE